MEKLNQLMDFIDYYHYDFDTDRIIIVEGEKYQDALTMYNEICSTYFSAENKWYFDIALDAIRTIPASDLMKNRPVTSDHKHSYGTIILNTYLYVSKTKSLNDGNEWQNVIEIMLSILNPNYSHLDEKQKDFYNDVYIGAEIKKWYEQYSEIFESAKKQYCENDISLHEIRLIIKENMRAAIGLDGYLKIIDQTNAKMVKEYEKRPALYRGKRQLDVFLEMLKFECTCFSKEFNQINAILKISNWQSILIKEMTSQNFKSFIDEEFNLKETDRDFVMECIMKILSMEVINETISI